jgi:hypothetical protein
MIAAQMAGLTRLDLPLLLGTIVTEDPDRARVAGLASHRAGPASTAALEPPELLGLNYGTQTPLVTVAAHAAYGIALGVLLNTR